MKDEFETELLDQVRRAQQWVYRQEEELQAAQEDLQTAEDELKEYLSDRECE